MWGEPECYWAALCSKNCVVTCILKQSVIVYCYIIVLHHVSIYNVCSPCFVSLVHHLKINDISKLASVPNYYKLLKCAQPIHVQSFHGGTFDSHTLRFVFQPFMVLYSLLVRFQSSLDMQLLQHSPLVNEHNHLLCMWCGATGVALA